MTVEKNVRKQGQYFQGRGDGTPAGGAYAAEKFAFTNAATGADRQVVAGVTGKRIRVLSYSLSAPAAGAATATFKSAAAAIGPLVSLATNGFASESSDSGLLETVAGEALNINTSATVGVRVSYIEVD